MKRLNNFLRIGSLIIFCWFLLMATPVAAQDITALQPIADVSNYAKTENTVTFKCRDRSQVQLTILAANRHRLY